MGCPVSRGGPEPGLALPGRESSNEEARETVSVALTVSTRHIPSLYSVNPLRHCFPASVSFCPPWSPCTRVSQVRCVDSALPALVSCGVLVTGGGGGSSLLLGEADPFVADTAW